MLEALSMLSTTEVETKIRDVRKVELVMQMWLGKAATAVIARAKGFALSVGCDPHWCHHGHQRQLVAADEASLCVLEFLRVVEVV